MSVENRPNLNAVGFMVEITRGLEAHIRGKAGSAGMKEVFPLVKEKLLQFVEEVDEMLDTKFGI